MRVTVVGSGYVGLVTGTCLATLGHRVTCVDKDASKIALLQRGEVPIFEPGLGDLIGSAIAAGRLSFATEIAGAADVFLIAVGTPARRSDGQADLSFVYSAAREIAFAASGPALVVTKSTVPVGTGDRIEQILSQARPELNFAVVSNPEFLREGSAIDDFMRPDRIVVGTSDPTAQQVMADLYAGLGESYPILFTARRTAELIKYAANAFLATKITFINEIANLCERIDADVGQVAAGMGLDHRIGASFLEPGPGYGGSCFPKDTLALLRTAQDHGVSLRLVEDTVAINDARKRAMARKVVEAVGGSVEGMTIAVLGLTFKPNTDDMREAPSLPLIEALQRGGAQVRAFDPMSRSAISLLSEVTLADDPYACARGADAVVLMTHWDELKRLDLRRLRRVMRNPIFIDLRNAYRPEALTSAGFEYVGIGTAPSVRKKRSAPNRAPIRNIPASELANVRAIVATPLLQSA